MGGIEVHTGIVARPAHECKQLMTDRYRFA